MQIYQSTAFAWKIYGSPRCSRQNVNFGDNNYIPRKLKYFDDFDISLEPIFEDNREEIEELKCLIEYYQKIDDFKIFY